MSERIEETHPASDISEESKGFRTEDPITELMEPDAPILSRLTPLPFEPLTVRNSSTMADPNQPNVNPPPIIAPIRGGLDPDGKTPWTGGNPANADREMEGLNCLRPTKNKVLPT